jgi:hypothetical protein
VYRELYELGELDRTLSVVVRRLVPDEEEDDEDDLDRGFKVHPSVADPGCLSRIPNPDFYPSRIPDPKTATKERGEKKLVVILFM